MMLFFELPFIKDFVNKENFQNNQDNLDVPNHWGFLHYIVSSIVIYFAVYLSWRCNNRFDFVQFLLAFLFAPIYILYHLATDGLCGILPKN
jgi:hypothetical protein